MKKNIPFIIIAAICIPFFHCGPSQPRKIKVVVLGFDGANWPTIDPLLAAGKLPFLRKLKEESAWADFQTDRPTKSSVIWTCIATGKRMIKHGIFDFTYMKKNKIQIPYSNAEKREPSIWQILDRFRKRSVVINWYVTYPPDHVNGVVVSNQFRKIILEDPAQANTLDDTVYPKIAFYRLKPFVRRNYQRTIRRIGLPDFPTLYQKTHPGKDIRDSIIQKNARILVMQDALVEDITDQLFKTETADMYITYFRLPDVVQHFVMRLLPDGDIEKMFANGGVRLRDPEQKKALLARASAALESTYSYMDRLLQKYMSNPRFKDAYFFIMSDHGFSLYSGGYSHYNLPKEVAPPPGILLIKGPTVKPGMINASIYDIAPTILYLFGMPLDRNMDGRPLRDIFKISRKLNYTVYKLNKQITNTHNLHVDQEEIEELKALGYIN